jgi:outer membrane protein assembly factor BamB
MNSGFYVIPSAQWGFANSPIIAEGKVIVLCDVLTNSFIAAYDLRDGKCNVARYSEDLFSN